MGLFLLAVLLAAETRLDAAVETGGHLRSPLPGESGADAARLVELSPSFTALVDEPGTALTARYAPRFLLGDASGVRQDALLKGSYQQTRNLAWAASSTFHYGRSEFTWDPGAHRPFDFLEALLPVVPDELFSDTEAGFSWLLGRTLSLNANAGFLVYGGASALSQETLPLQKGPQLYVGLDQDLTRLDRLETSLFASSNVISGGRHNQLVELSEGYRRLLGPATRASLSLGASATRRTDQSGVHPLATAELQHDLLGRSQRLELTALASLAPHQSRITGDLVQRAEVQAAARWVLGEDFSLRGRAAAAREFGAARLLLGALDAIYRPRPDISFTAGAETLWQDLPAQPAAPTFHWVAFTAVTIAVPGIL